MLYRPWQTWQRPTLPSLHDLVPSAQGSLTAEFGMGSGSGSPQIPPGRPKTMKHERSERPRVSRDLDPQNWSIVFSASISDFEMGIGNESNQDNRAISTGKLNALPRLHTRPINVVVYHGSQGRTRFEVGFSLRCFQRLSRPYVATLHCGWRHNSSTRGTFIPVLSY